MVTVTAHGPRKRIQNPANPNEWTDVQLVTFQERGRGGLNESMASSSAALDEILGVKTGLDIVRTHTHPIRIEAIAGLPVGRELPLFINRKLFSKAQLTQQVDVAPRMIDGKPTFITTSLDKIAKDDEDVRMTNTELLQSDANAFSNVRVGAANVQTIDDILNNVLESSTVSA